MNAETRAKEIDMTPEERAWEVACDIVSSDDTYDMAEKIAQAIRQAQNDKLEEAAAWLDNRAEFYESRSTEAIDVYHAAERMFGAEACAYAADHIRSLKKD